MASTLESLLEELDTAQAQKARLDEMLRETAGWDDPETDISLSTDKTGHEHKGKGAHGGEFTSKGGGSGATPDSPGTTAAKQHVAKRAAAKVKAAHNLVAEKGSETFQKLPKPIQWAVTQTLSLCKGWSVSWAGAQALAHSVAHHTGATPEEAKKLSSTLAAYDLATYKPLTLATGAFAPVIGAAAYVVPPVTAAYLMYATVAHPLATFRAAMDMVLTHAPTIASAAHSVLGLSVSKEEKLLLINALHQHKYDDWYIALLHASMLKTKNAQKSVELADAIYKKQPKDESTPRDDDEDAVLRGKDTSLSAGNWDETKHPRGQPGNAGEFGPGGGQAGKAPQRQDTAQQAGQGGGAAAKPAEAEVPEHVRAAQEDYQKNGVLAKAFISWFGDWQHDPKNASKVVNEQGQPMKTGAMEGGGAAASKVTDPQTGRPIVVYHGTKVANLEEFRKDAGGNGAKNAFGRGFYFAASKNQAQIFEGPQGATHAVYLNIRKPFNLDQEFTREQAEQITGQKWGLLKSITRLFNKRGPQTGNPTGHELFEAIAKAGGGNDAATNRMKQLGYDGLTHTQGAVVKDQGASGNEAWRVWIAFEPEQIKAANNRGTFDPDNPKIAMSAAYDESKHPRGEHGRWTEGEHAKALVDDALQGAADDIEAAKIRVKSEIAALNDVLHEAGKETFEALPEPVQEAATTALGVAFTGWTASQALAERISREKGSTPEEAAKTRSILAAWDLAFFKPIAIATHFIGPMAGIASWIIPPVTAGYVVCNLVRHPLATFRAAMALIKNASRDAADVAREHIGLSADTDPQVALVDALEAHGWDDWYCALLHAAIAEAKDIGQAAALADTVYDEHPEDVSEPRDDDADALFAAPKAKPRRSIFNKGKDVSLSTDKSGHEHKGKGKGGGQFVGKGKGGGSEGAKAPSPKKHQAVELYHLEGDAFRAKGYDAIDAACAALRKESNEDVAKVAAEILGSDRKMSKTGAIKAIRDRMEDRMAKLDKGEVIAKGAQSANEDDDVVDAEEILDAIPVPEDTPAPRPAPGDKRRENYIAQAMANLKRTSRTATGTVDTSASKGKAGQMVEGLTGGDAAAKATKNFESVVGALYDQRDHDYSNPARVQDLCDNVNKELNKGITKEGVLLRTDDSDKFPYAKVADIPLARKQFAEEFARKLSDPNADPIETAAWVEWRVNRDHVYADGCGKTQRALAAIPLMKANLPLPNYDDPKKFFKYMPSTPYDPKQGADNDTKGEDYKRFLNYYRMRCPAYGTRAVRQVEKHYPPANPLGVDALERHMTGTDAHGLATYTPERTELHAKIAKKLREGVPASKDKTYMIMGGGPASGKSSVIRMGLVKKMSGDNITLPDAKTGKTTSHVHIDSDSIKGELPEMQLLRSQGDMRAADYVHEESSDCAKSIQAQSFAAGQDVLLDGTGDNSVDSMEKKCKAARAAGYKVQAAYTTCSTEEAVRRNVIRAFGGPKAREMGYHVNDNEMNVHPEGRLPPEDMLRAVHKGVSTVLPELLKRAAFDQVTLHDTEHKTDGKPTLVMSTKGAEVTIHHPELWQAFLGKAK